MSSDARFFQRLVIEHLKVPTKRQKFVVVFFFKKNQTEIPDMKIKIIELKNSLDGFNNRLAQAEENQQT